MRRRGKKRERSRLAWIFSKWRSKKEGRKRKSLIRDDDFSATRGLSGLKLGGIKWNRRRKKRVDEGGLRSRPLGWVITRSSGICKKKKGKVRERRRCEEGEEEKERFIATAFAQINFRNSFVKRSRLA